MNKRRKLESSNKKNWCCSFILPMVEINYNNLPRNFINAYISKDYEVFMVFDKTQDYDVVFYHFLENIKNKNTALKEVLDGDDEIVFRFNIPKKYFSDFNLFIQGKYSKFADVYKKVLIKYFGQVSISHNYEASVYNTINPQDFKRLQIAERLYDKRDIREGLKLIDEVLDIPDMERELFKPLQSIIQPLDTTDIKYEQGKQDTI